MDSKHKADVEDDTYTDDENEDDETNNKMIIHRDDTTQEEMDVKKIHAEFRGGKDNSYTRTEDKEMNER